MIGMKLTTDTIELLTVGQVTALFPTFTGSDESKATLVLMLPLAPPLQLLLESRRQILRRIRLQSPDCHLNVLERVLDIATLVWAQVCGDRPQWCICGRIYT